MKAKSGPPIQVASVTPTLHTTKVDGAAPIRVAFSAPMASGSPLPTINPSVPGSWKRNGAGMVFTPTTPFAPWTKVTVTVPAGTAGVRSEAGGMLAAPVTDHFETAAPSSLRVQQLFAKLGYLPLTWSPAAPTSQRATPPRNWPRPIRRRRAASPGRANPASLKGHGGARRIRPDDARRGDGLRVRPRHGGRRVPRTARVDGAAGRGRGRQDQHQRLHLRGRQQAQAPRR